MGKKILYFATSYPLLPMANLSLATADNPSPRE